MRSTTRLRELLRQPEMLVAPGAYDGLTALLVERAGHAAVYMTGAGASLAKGFPDFGLLGMGEMIANAATMAHAIAVPLISDADTGYGNELNVTRTVREFEAAGVAAIHIEDQVSPKRCGHLDGKEVVAREEFLAKIAAAVAARRDPDFVIIARTDARAVIGLDEAVSRANAALRLGADLVFVEAVQSMEELASVPRLVAGPCLLNIVPGGKTPPISLQAAQALGYRLAILPALVLGAMIDAAEQALRDLGQTGTAPDKPTVGEIFDRFGAGEWDALRRRFSNAEFSRG